MRNWRKKLSASLSVTVCSVFFFSECAFVLCPHCLLLSCHCANARNICLEGSGGVVEEASESVIKDHLWEALLAQCRRCIGSRSAVHIVGVVEINSARHATYLFTFLEEVVQSRVCEKEEKYLTMQQQQKPWCWDPASLCAAVFPSSCQVDFTQTFQTLAKIKCELGPFPSAGLRHINTPPDCQKTHTSTGRNWKKYPEKMNILKNWSVVDELPMTVGAFYALIWWWKQRKGPVLF